MVPPTAPSNSEHGSSHWIRTIHTAKLTAGIIFLLTFDAAAGVAQTLTSTFQFTASGWIGTPATVSTPFQGSVFTNAAITITAVAFTGTMRSVSPGAYLINDSVTVSISGVGTFEIVQETYTYSYPVVDPVQGLLGYYISLYNGTYNPLESLITAVYPMSTPWNIDSSLVPTQMANFVNFNLSTSGGTLSLNNFNVNQIITFQTVLTSGVPCAASQSGATNVEDVQGIISEALGTTLPATELNGDGVINVVEVQTVINAVRLCGTTTSGITPAGFSTRIPTFRKRP